MLTLSTHVSGFTLHTVIWFTLSKHMLGSKFSDFHKRSFFYAYTLHTCFRINSPYSYLVYTLQAHVRFKIFRFLRETIFSCLHSPHMFQGSLSIQLFGLHSPSTCWFKIFKFSQKFFFHAYTLHTFQDSLSIQVFGLHSPSTCCVQNFQIFSDHFFMLSLSTHVSGFTLHTVIWFTLSKHMLGSTFLDFHRISFVSYLHSSLMFQSPLSMQMLHFKMLYSFYSFIMCLNAPLNHECLTP